MWQKHNIQLANFDLASLRVIWFRWATALPTAFGSALPQPTEGQRSGNYINAAFAFARADFVKVLRARHRDRSYHFVIAALSTKRAESAA